MSAAASKKFPFSVECKNQEGFKNVYKVYQQAVDQDDGYIPLVVLKSNRQKPLVVLEAEAFFDIILGEPTSKDG